MKLTSIDLNLLVVLRALLTERHVTRAGRRLGMSQPAVSRALGKLRELFQDELLVRVGQRMQRTPRADDMVAPLDALLGDVGQFVAPSEFEPANARGRVRLAWPDILAFMVGPALMRHLAEHAPHLDVEIVQWSVHWREQLAGGDVDVTIGAPTADDRGIYASPLVRNEWACVLRAEHPVVVSGRRWTKHLYARLSHLLIGFTPYGGGQVDEALRAHGLERRVALRMPYVVLSPLVIAETDLVLTTARWLACKLAASANLVIKKPPVPLTPVDLQMVWHERSHRDPRQRWLRGVIALLAKDASSRHTKIG